MNIDLSDSNYLYEHYKDFAFDQWDNVVSCSALIVKVVSDKRSEKIKETYPVKGKYVFGEKLNPKPSKFLFKGKPSDVHYSVSLFRNFSPTVHRFPLGINLKKSDGPKVHRDIAIQVSYQLEWTNPTLFAKKYQDDDHLSEEAVAKALEQPIGVEVESKCTLAVANNGGELPTDLNPIAQAIEKALNGELGLNSFQETVGSLQNWGLKVVNIGLHFVDDPETIDVEKEVETQKYINENFPDPSKE
jgi:hypothetical protein